MESCCFPHGSSLSSAKKTPLSRYGDYSLFLLGLAPPVLSQSNISHPSFSRFLFSLHCLDKARRCHRPAVSLVTPTTPSQPPTLTSTPSLSPLIRVAYLQFKPTLRHSTVYIYYLLASIHIVSRTAVASTRSKCDVQQVGCVFSQLHDLRERYSWRTPRIPESLAIMNFLPDILAHNRPR